LAAVEEGRLYRRRAWNTSGLLAGSFESHTQMNTTMTPEKKLNTNLRNKRMNHATAGQRCMLWVDGVGGFLTCFSVRVEIGQAVSETQVDVPLLGDLSRHHAVLERQDDVYLIEPHGPTWVESRQIDKPRVLADGDEIRLGDSVSMRFRQPHALSSTARIDFLSTHRTQPSADGVLLMAGSCILGASDNCHVVCRHWQHEVVLVRQRQALACHVNTEFEVDGSVNRGRAPVTMSSTIQGDDFCLSLEHID